MNLQQLTTFCTVISEGSMTAAADKLYLTQPAVSQQIRSLEEELKTPLLVRGVRQVKPTIQGQLLYDYAKRILHLTQQAQVAIQTMSQELSGSLSIGTLNSLGLYMISPIVGLFLRHNTHLNIRLVYGSYDQILNNMISGALDIGILPDVKEEIGRDLPDFDSRLLMKDEMWLVASGRDASLPTEIPIREIVSRPAVAYSDMYPAFQRQFDQIVKDQQIRFSPVFQTDNVGTLKRVVESGLGWGFLPAHSIRKQVRNKRLTQIVVSELQYGVNVCMYNRRAEPVRRMSEVFFRALQQQIMG
jgi:DNA-binding transcriptional LysR family regulator